MQQMLDFAMGPLFAFSFSLMVLGLVRVAVITLWGMKSAVDRAGDKNIPYSALIKETLSWIFPFRHLLAVRAFFSVTSVIFHVGIILVPLLLIDHILLWRQIGISWPAIPKPAADFLTITTLVSGAILFFNRIFHANTRFLSRKTDYFLILSILIIFITGFTASKSWGPLPYEKAMLIHALFGNLILLMIPFSKLAHCFLFPLLRIASNIAWHFPASAGEDINKALYGEEIRKI